MKFPTHRTPKTQGFRPEMETPRARAQHLRSHLGAAHDELPEYDAETMLQLIGENQRKLDLIRREVERRVMES
jgi:hypothetical protein